MVVSLAIFTLHSSLREEEGDGRGEVTIQIYAAITYFQREESFAINLCSPICMSDYQGLSYTFCCRANLELYTGQLLHTDCNFNFNLFLAIFGYIWLSLTVSAYLWLSLSLFGCFALFWAISWYLSIYMAISENLGLSLAIFSYLWQSLAISGRFRLYRTISVYLGLSLAISGYIWLSLAISAYLGLSLPITKHQVAREARTSNLLHLKNILVT